MNHFINRNILNHSARLIVLIVLLEYILFVISGVSFSFLSGSTFFNIGVDPVYWLFYFLKIPQTILSNQWAAVLSDALVILLLLMLLLNANRYVIARFCFLLLLIFYVTLTGYHTHRNFQSGFFWVLFPFIFKKQNSRHLAFSFIRYFLLFFYFSAGILKVMDSTFFDIHHLINHLSAQYAPYFLEGNKGFRTSLNLFLIKKSVFSYTLFVCSAIAELMVVIAFFTRKFDKWLGLILLTFHVFNWLIMDIAPFGQLAFISILLFNVFPPENADQASQ